MLSWDEPGGSLLIGLAVSGIKVARAGSGLHSGTGELLDVKQRSAGVAAESERESRKWEQPRAAEYRSHVGRAERLVVARKSL